MEAVREALAGKSPEEIERDPLALAAREWLRDGFVEARDRRLDELERVRLPCPWLDRHA